jgi:protein TonB
VRPSWFVLSLIAHGAALGTAVAFGVQAANRAPRVAPRVTLEESLPSRPAPPPVAQTLSVQPEPSPMAPLPELEVAFAEPVQQPDPVPAAAPERADQHAWQQAAAVRVRASAAAPTDPVPTSKPTPPRVEPQPPVVEPPAPPQAFVPADRRADNEAPRYPEADRQRGNEGVVVVRAAIDAAGVVTAVALQRACAHPGLNRAALAAVRGWRFEPARERGTPVASELDVRVEFRLVAD